MLGRRTFFRDILQNEAATKFVLNALSVGETDGGRNLAQVADRCASSDLRQKIRRHFRDEIRHGVLYARVLGRLGVHPHALPVELDYEAAIRRAGIGLSPERLQEARPLDDDEYVLLFACMKVTEDRAWSNTRMLRDGFAPDATLRACADEVLQDEAWHRAYASAELARLASAGRRQQVRRTLRGYRRKEARAYLAVTLPYIDRITSLLGYGLGRRLLMKLGCATGCLWTLLTPPALEARRG